MTTNSKMALLAVGSLVLFGLSGCSNPYLSPATAKAFLEEKQTQIMVDQTKLMLRQTIALEKIAASIEKK
jgi:hypothetical protein